MILFIKKLFYLILLVMPVKILSQRNPLRIYNDTIPQIHTQWSNDNKDIHQLSDSHLELYPIFYTFNKDFFYKNLLPLHEITYRYNYQKSVKGSHLNKIMHTLIHDISSITNKRKAQKISYMSILKDRDFNYKQHFGVIIVKLHQYPFIIKIFMETPESFVHPYQKSLEQGCFFIVGGGINRHLLGFTRIKNKQIMQNKIKLSKLWNDKVSFPRKWFWLPNNPQWIKITGDNIGNHKKITINIPATYAIICDEIQIKKSLSLTKKNDQKIAISLSNFLNCSVDPHITNFVIENKTNKIVIVDTEHLPTLCGIKEKPIIKSYIQWYKYLVCKGIKNYFCRTKKERLNLQDNPQKPFSMV